MNTHMETAFDAQQKNQDHNWTHQKKGMVMAEGLTRKYKT